MIVNLREEGWTYKAIANEVSAKNYDPITAGGAQYVCDHAAGKR